MQVLFFSPTSQTADAPLWLSALQQALPASTVRSWQPGDDLPADYAIVWRPIAEVLSNRSDLKAIFNLGAGVDAILKLGHAVPAQVPIIRLDDAGMALQMVHYVSHAVLRYFRCFDQYLVQQHQANWRPIKTPGQADFSIGILGLGILGSHIGKALTTLGFKVHGWSRNSKQVDGVTGHAGRLALPAFLAASRVVVCVLPLTDDTSGLLDRATMSLMPRGSYLINVARGAHLIEEDLLELIESGHIAGATLDVFHQEPLPADHPFWREARITITPHIAALTQLDESVRQITEKIGRIERGEPVTGVVDRVRGY